MTRLGFVAIVVFVALSTGCAIRPRVAYREAPTKDKDGSFKFYLARSDLTLAPADEKKESGESGTASAKGLSQKTIEFGSDLEVAVKLSDSVKILSTQTESRKKLYAVQPRHGFLRMTSTNLSVQYFETSSKLVQEIGTEVVDDRKTAIAAVGGFATLVKGGFSTQGVEGKIRLALPVAIDAYQAKDGAWHDLPRNPGWAYRLVVETNDPETRAAVPTDEFFRDASKSRVSVFPVSACSHAKLQVIFEQDVSKRNSVDPDAVFPVTIADPDFVEAVALPGKGKVKMRSACGADVVSDSADTSSEWDLTEKIMEQVKSLRESQSGGDEKK